MKKEIRKLIEKYEQAVRDVVNPDMAASWEDLGLDEPPFGFEDINDYLEAEADEGEQVELRVYREVVEDLKKLVEVVI